MKRLAVGLALALSSCGMQSPPNPAYDHNAQYERYMEQAKARYQPLPKGTPLPPPVPGPRNSLMGHEATSFLS